MDFNYYVVSNVTKCVVAGFMHASDADEFAKDHELGSMKYTVLGKELAQAVAANWKVGSFHQTPAPSDLDSIISKK